MNDGKLVRLNIPTLSEERREELKKVAKEMAKVEWVLASSKKDKKSTKKPSNGED